MAEFTQDGVTFEHYANFPAFFQSQSSKSGSTAGDIEIKLSVPIEGRLAAISLMDTQGEELRLIVARRVFGEEDDEGGDG